VLEESKKVTVDKPTNGQPNSSDVPPIAVETDHRAISGFWRRLLAFIIDGLLLGLVGCVCGLFLFDLLAHLGGWGRLVGFSVAFPYFGLLNSGVGRGQTVGKRVMKIEVVDRAGQHIALGWSLLRYVILGTPFFLNFALIPPSVMMSPIGHIIGFILFGFGGAIIYLYVFNRHTRQSLHDLAVGTFVTRTSPPGEVVGSVWRPHIVVVGIWFLSVVVLSVVMTGLSQKGVLPGLLDVQRAIQASGNVHVATVNVGKSWRIVDGSRSETTYFYSNAIWKQRPQDEETAARSVASIILSNYPKIMEKDMLIVVVSYGYDIGIARVWKSHTSSHSPIEWQKLVAENSEE
jgi:uncharacterized RDD family membrane protein YckC